MRAMLLVAGEGRRLGSLTKWLPKPLLSVANTPLLVHTLKALGDIGITEVHTNPCYLAGKFMDQAKFCTPLRTNDGVPMQLIHHPEEWPMGTAGGLRQALVEETGSFLVIYGDNWLGCNLKELVKVHDDSGADLTLGLFNAPNIHQASWVVMNQNGWVTRFVEKPAVVEGDDPLSFAGVMVIKDWLIRHIPVDMPLDLGFSMIPYWIQHAAVRGWRLNGPVIDIGTPKGYLDANLVTLKGIKIDPSATIEPGATLIAPVTIGPCTLIQSSARVGPSAVIGKDCVIGGHPELCVVTDEVLIPRTQGLIRAIQTPYEVIRTN